MRAILVVVLFSSSCVMCDFSNEWVTFGDLNDATQEWFPRRVSACGFTREDEVLIYAAVDNWNTLTGTKLFQVSTQGCKDSALADLTITNANYDAGTEAATTYVWHCGNNVCRDVWALVYAHWWRQAPWHKQAIIRHELGHYLGLGHAFSQGCLMFGDAKRASPDLCDDEKVVLCAHYPWLDACY